MTIAGFKVGNMLDPDTFRRKDRFLFDLPAKHTGLKIHELAETTGFNFYKQLIELGIPLDTYSGSELGDIWTYEDEETYTTWHGVVMYSLDSKVGYTGYHPHMYEAIVPALDNLYESVSDDWVRPARSLLLGHGQYHATGEEVLPPYGYDFKWNQDMATAVLANTEFEVEIWGEDFPERIEEQYS